VVLGGAELPDRQEHQQQQQETYRGAVFAVSFVLSDGKRALAAPSQIGWSEARKEEWDGVIVLVERRAMVSAQFAFFAAHDDGVEQGEIAEQEGRWDPRMGGDRHTQREDRAAEIERVASVGVGPRDREDRLFVEMACCQGTNEQTYDSDKCAIENALRSGVSQH